MVRGWDGIHRLMRFQMKMAQLIAPTGRQIDLLISKDVQGAPALEGGSLQRIPFSFVNTTIRQPTLLRQVAKILTATPALERQSQHPRVRIVWETQYSPIFPVLIPSSQSTSDCRYPPIWLSIWSNRWVAKVGH